MTFMLSSVRDDTVAEQTSSGNKRKSLSFLPSSPTKLKRLDRSHARGSSLSLLSASSLTTSTISRLSSFSSHKPSKRAGQLSSPSSRKSPPTCTISLENVTVNICDEDRNLSKSCTSPRTLRDTPFETVDVNVIPFPTAALDEPEPQPSSSSPLGRRRRSNHLLLGHRRSSSVHSISPQHRKENQPVSVPPSPRRQSTTSKKSKSNAAGSSNLLSTKTASYSLKDIRFIAMIRRSVMHGIIWREDMGVCNKMEVDEVQSSGSVTFDILNDNDEDEPDENIDPLAGTQLAQDRIMHNQDVLLVDRLSKILSDWSYHERDPLAPLSSLPSHPRMPLAPVALSPVTVSAPSLAVTVDSSSMMMPVAAPVGTIMLPDLDGHATSVTFFDDIRPQDQDEVMMDMDVDQPERPERPTSPVARCLEPTDENDAFISNVEAVESCSQSLTPLLPIFGLSDSLQQKPIITPIPSPPPVSPFAPGSSPQCILSPSQLVATLVLRHREKTAVRSRGYHSQGGMRRRSPLARELQLH